MKLLSIKAHGFKSFADKIEINVGDGITGIVGPNGSGKSNVVDAVRWVLGESSLKEIRGGETSTDVIFNGSSSRAAQSHAWVSLTFDNKDHFLQTEFDEVEIKREVYKTGENEYYINNAKVRKKDITDLFLDSGANADSFSIISQGKVVEILKGRPQDRRVIIEEAAGVLKYKKRKEETVRKLDNTNDNLEKVSLVINELETSLEPLRLQAEVAKKYVEYKDELKGIEIALLGSDIKKINDVYQESKERLEKLNDELIGMDSSSSQDNTKLENLKLESIKVDNDIQSMNDEIMKLQESIANLESRKQVISERKKYEVEDQKLENNILILKENEFNLKKNISVVDVEIKLLEEEKNKIASDLSKIDEEYKAEVLKKNTFLSEVQNKNKELEGKKNKIDLLELEIANDSRIPYAVKSVLNNPRLSGIHDVLAKLIDTEDKYVTAIETCLGANANVIVVDNENSAKKAIEYLKDQALGRATFFPINVITPRGVDEETLSKAKSTAGFIDVASSLVKYDSKYHDIIENQLGNVLIVDNIDTMNKLGKDIGYRYRIITLDGELLHTGGSITGGQAKRANGVINSRYELEKLKKDHDALANSITLIENDIAGIESDIAILENKLFDIKTKETTIVEQISSKKNTLDEYNNQLKNTQDELSGTSNLLKNESDKELDEVMNELLKTTTDKELKLQKLSDLKSKKNDISAEINEIELENRKNMSGYNKKMQEIKDLEVSIGKMDIRLDTSLTRLSEEYQMTYERAISEYTLDLDEDTARSKVNRLKRDIKDLGDVNVGSIAEYERINERYTFLDTQRQDLLNAISDLMNVISDLDNTVEEKFKETFEKVNEEFKRVFKELFKGGEASLSLTDPEDILNTGVDISACPPGKSLKSINSLSGGEMTLTAIALLFSILNIRIVPFCILDEVEAALDEANVDTFGTYIKNNESKTQFVVITHKKRTMEYATNLYGITMQESGVSKLVSVKLENIEDNIDKK